MRMVIPKIVVDRHPISRVNTLVVKRAVAYAVCVNVVVLIANQKRRISKVFGNSRNVVAKRIVPTPHFTTALDDECGVPKDTKNRFVAIQVVDASIVVHRCNIGVEVALRMFVYQCRNDRVAVVEDTNCNPKSMSRSDLSNFALVSHCCAVNSGVSDQSGNL